MTEVPLEQCKDFINENYVKKLLEFLRGESKRVTTNKEYMKVYQLIIYQCDTNDNNEQIYDIFEEFVNDYLRTEVLPLLNGASGERLLINLVKAWNDYVIYSKMMDRSFEYLNRYYLKNNQLQLVGEKCMSMFHEKVFNQHQQVITEAILKQIKADRAGDAIAKETVKKCIQVYVDLGLVKPKPMRTKDGLFLWQGDRNLTIYDDFFESEFLKSTQKESEQSANLWNQTRNCPEYLREVQKMLENEESNADYWL